MEKGLGPDREVVARGKGAQQLDTRVLGDVYVHTPADVKKQHYFLDVGFQTVMASAGLQVTRDAAQAVWDLKRKKVQDSDLLRPGMEYIPIAISTSGKVHEASMKHPLLQKIPKAGWRRIVAAGLMRQATEAASLLEKLEHGAAANLAVMQQRAQVDGRVRQPGGGGGDGGGAAAAAGGGRGRGRGRHANGRGRGRGPARGRGRQWG